MIVTIYQFLQITDKTFLPKENSNIHKKIQKEGKGGKKTQPKKITSNVATSRKRKSDEPQPAPTRSSKRTRAEPSWKQDYYCDNKESSVHC